MIKSGDVNNDTLQLRRPVKQIRQGKVADPYRSIKRAIWWYFWLLIFEGALRKWVLPGLSTPLLVVRDPIALYIVLAASSKGLLKSNIFVFGMVSIATFAMFTTLILGHQNLPVAIYGVRIFLFHFPMMFVIGKVFTHGDVIKMGKIVMYIAIPMAVLIGLQFYSPQSAWVNRGLGDDASGAGFSGALGYFRPPGTFSFTTGNSLFFGFAAAFVMYFLFNPKKINKLILLGACMAVVVSIPLSISRTLTFQIAGTVGFAFIAILSNPKNLGKGLVAVFALTLVFLALSKSSLFQTATNVLSTRFNNAGSSEGGLEGTLGDRYLGGLLFSLSSAADQPFFGYGLGMGTKVGAQLLSGNRRAWLIAEAEWGRLVGEMGALMGLSVIALRVVFVFRMSFIGYFRMIKGDMLTWMLLSYGFMLIAQGSWGQPTSLGFSTLIGGLMLASLNNPEFKAKVAQRKRVPVMPRPDFDTMNTNNV